MRSDSNQDQLGGEDSFLDVVANVVGVLIILVMVVSVRASYSVLDTNSAENRPHNESPPLADKATATDDVEIEPLVTQLDAARRQAIQSQAEIEAMAQKIIRINHESAMQEERRLQLNMLLSVQEEDMQERRSQLDKQQQQEYDVQQSILQSRLKLDELMREQLALTEMPAEVEQIECVPTPLAKTIQTEAVHLRLRHGLVSLVPFQELMAEIQYHRQRIGNRLRDQSKVSETFGPIDGYRIRFEVIRYDSSSAVGGRLAGQSAGRMEVEYRAEFLPVSQEIGQQAEQALMPGSTIHAYLEQVRRHSPPVVIWLYTDSFDAFRLLKRELWERGFEVAVRPLPNGAQIGASSRGTKASAQ